MNGLMDEWIMMDQWTDVWTDRQTDDWGVNSLINISTDRQTT